MTGRAPNLTEKLASTLIIVGEIPHRDAQQMTAAQINSLFDFDHYPIRRNDGGSNHPSNLVPRYKLAHREKTAKIDKPQMAKADRLNKAQQETRRRLLMKSSDEPRLQPRWGSRKLQSRPFQKRRAGT